MMMAPLEVKEHHDFLVNLRSSTRKTLYCGDCQNLRSMCKIFCHLCKYINVLSCHLAVPRPWATLCVCLFVCGSTRVFTVSNYEVKHYLRARVKSPRPINLLCPGGDGSVSPLSPICHTQTQTNTLWRAGQTQIRSASLHAIFESLNFLDMIVE